MNKKVQYLCHGAIIAALYVVLTYVASALGLASHAIQVRFSEALTILPIFTPAAVPGVTVGCLLANTLTGCDILDIIFGTLATLAGAVGTYYIGRISKWLAPVPPILANTLVVPFIVKFVYMDTYPLWFTFLTVFAGEVISCGILGILLIKVLTPVKTTLFGN